MTKTDKKKDRPFVFVRCLTYNHENYIEDALKGFAMQITDFPFLAVVIDDCSTDGTADIVRRYEAMYPDKIKGIYLPHNFTQTKEDKKPYYQKYADKAKYWAECEGDDCWIDPYKLQKQVDFMDSHPECSVTFHRCKHYSEYTKEWSTDGLEYMCPADEPAEISIPHFFKHWCTQPLTMMYRTSMYDQSVRMKYIHFWDTYQIYHLLSAGKGYLLPFIGGVHIIHSKGMSGGLQTDVKRCEFELISANELYNVNRCDSAVRKYWQDTVLWAWNVYACAGEKRRLHVLIKNEWHQFPNAMTKVMWIQCKRKLKAMIGRG